MKARAYFELYKSNPSDELLARICQDIIIESKALIEQRYARTNAAMFSILEETDGKWRAFARLCDSINGCVNLDGLQEIIKLKLPETYVCWMDYKRQMKNRMVHHG